MVTEELSLSGVGVIPISPSCRNGNGTDASIHQDAPFSSGSKEVKRARHRHRTSTFVQAQPQGLTRRVAVAFVKFFDIGQSDDKNQLWSCQDESLCGSVMSIVTEDEEDCSSSTATGALASACNTSIVVDEFDDEQVALDTLNLLLCQDPTGILSNSTQKLLPIKN